MTGDYRRHAERKKILQRLNSFEGDGLSEKEVKWLEQRGRENERRREIELEKGRLPAPWGF